MLMWLWEDLWEKISESVQNVKKISGSGY